MFHVCIISITHKLDQRGSCSKIPKKKQVRKVQDWNFVSQSLVMGSEITTLLGSFDLVRDCMTKSLGVCLIDT